ncbi:MAG: hypothetical protein KIS92_25385 [Planctomycetota bacterium]|nr:hypothetical protein [Planctomycetota bacterium]
MPQAIELALQLEPGVPFEDQIWSVVHAHGATAAKELATALGQGPRIRVRDYQVSKTKQDGEASSRLPHMIASQVTIHAGLNAGVELEFSWHKSDPEKVFARVRPSSQSQGIADWIMYAGGILGAIVPFGFPNMGEKTLATVIVIGICFVVGLLAGAIAARIFLFLSGSWRKAQENAALEEQVERWVRERFPPAPAS